MAPASSVSYLSAGGGAATAPAPAMAQHIAPAGAGGSLQRARGLSIDYDGLAVKRSESREMKVLINLFSFVSKIHRHFKYCLYCVVSCICRASRFLAEILLACLGMYLLKHTPFWSVLFICIIVTHSSNKEQQDGDLSDKIFLLGMV